MSGIAVSPSLIALRSCYARVVISRGGVERDVHGHAAAQRVEHDARPFGGGDEAVDPAPRGLGGRPHADRQRESLESHRHRTIEIQRAAHVEIA